MLLDSRESRKRNCKLPGLRHGNLAISSQRSRQKTTLAQRVRNSSRATILAAAMATLSATYVNAQEFVATLSGFQELGALNAETGAIFTNGQGTFQLKLDQKQQSVTYTLTYSNLTS